MDVMSMIPLEEVGVYIERDANATVPELLLDVFGIGPLLNQETGECMPEVMEAYVPQSRRRETGLKGIAHEFIAHPLVRGSDEDPRRQWRSFHRRVERPHLFQPLENLGQLGRHIHAPDLVSFGRSDLPAHDRSSHFNELAAEVEISPLQAEQFALPHPRAYRTEEERIEQGGRVFRLVEDLSSRM